MHAHDSFLCEFESAQPLTAAQLAQRVREAAGQADASVLLFVDARLLLDPNALVVHKARTDEFVFVAALIDGAAAAALGSCAAAEDAAGRCARAELGLTEKLARIAQHDPLLVEPLLKAVCEQNSFLPGILAKSLDELGSVLGEAAAAPPSAEPAAAALQRASALVGADSAAALCAVARHCAGDLELALRLLRARDD